jgi:spore maturation protein CgeB
MKIVIFGLAVSSSWGNGHATLWRGLCRALARRGHEVIFFERDVPYYASHRDLDRLPGGGELILFGSWEDAVEPARHHLAEADIGMVTSYCPDGIAAGDLVLGSPAGLRVFYDLDTPVTLDRLRCGDAVTYIGPRGLVDYDLVLSYTGGRALCELQARLAARWVAPLYGSVDPETHRPVPPEPQYTADLSYLGTYAADRQRALERLLIEPARQRPQRRFLIGGAMYPPDFPWTSNIYFVRHVVPADHPAFFCSSRITLNITRRAMAEMGYCPSGRLFEAAACGAPILTDPWEGLESFFAPGREVLVAGCTEDALRVLDLGPEELAEIARAARRRVLEEHTAECRVVELERVVNVARSMMAAGTGFGAPPGGAA